MLDLFAAGGQLGHAAAIDDVDLVCAQALCAAGGVHGDVAAADHGDLLAVLDGGLGVVLVGLHQIDAGQELVGGVHALEGLARDAHEAGQASAGADEHGLVAHLKQLVHGQHLADDHVGLDVHAHRLEVVDLLVDDGLGQTELRNAVGQHAAGDVQRLVDGDLVAQAGQVARAGQTRGAGADDGDLMAVGCGGLGGLGGMLAVPVSDEALQTADAHGFALDAAHALGFALGLLGADAAADCRQGGLLVQDLKRALDVLVGDALDEGGDVDVHRAGGHAGLVLAVQAAAGLADGHFIGITGGHFLEHLVAIVGCEGGHRALGQAHILLRHVTRPPS